MSSVLRSGCYTVPAIVSAAEFLRAEWNFARNWRRVARFAASSWLCGIPHAYGAAPQITYGPFAAEVAEICQPRIDLGPRPAILLIHGGGWTSGDKATLSQRSKALASYGYTVMNINYRLADGSPEHAWPAALDDARQALSWLRTHAMSLGVDRARIGIIGASAGAQLAVFLGAAGLRSGVACIVEESGPIDLLTAPSFTSVVSPDVFVSRPVEVDYKSASPIFNIGRTSAPMMIVHGYRDALVPFDQAQELLSMLHRKAVPAVMVAYDGGHVMQDAAPGERQRVDIVEMAYLNGHLKPDDGFGNFR